ncbi:phosphatidylethanolamine N-methyltransferase isoform X3 [Salvelinus sp. IW2-2015]|uniref:phosphatidylethanolamine N-methyltransferase isoform X3 n=1 Tax=Salvelinus sp. IW2-2015 TaxID=2691554 RepID=UPI000CDFD6DE|nr:phosphatidylethanolamine N-methyltransferase isoform X3 [Salvelinus alpinus]
MLHFVSYVLKVDMSVMEDVLKHIDVYDPRFCVAVIAIIFNPFFWNVVARWEHRTRGLTRLFGGPYLACYCLGTLIILLNVYRSHSMTVAMKAQARWEVMASPEVFYAGAALMALGSVLVVTSFLALGFTGTFLGDYFGILMEEKVKGFPFNVTENPMYWGSTANYLGLAFISPLMRWLKLLVFDEAFDVSWQRRRRYSQLVFQVLDDDELSGTAKALGEECQSGGVGADSSGSHFIQSGHHL